MLDKVWDIASHFYHSAEESQFFSSLIFNETKSKSVSIIDVSCGTGFPIIYMLDNGFDNLYCSDGYLPNVELLNAKLIQRNHKLRAHHVSFEKLPFFYKSNFDCVFSIGTSITYCESWDLNKGRNLNNHQKEVLKSIEGMAAITKTSGMLVIGISNLYDRNKEIDSIVFSEKLINGIPYSMDWVILYDWKSLKKSWHSKIYRGGELIYQTYLESHLLTLDVLCEMCNEYFCEISVVRNQEKSSESYVLCKVKKQK